MVKYQQRLGIWGTLKPLFNRFIAFAGILALALHLQACSKGVKYKAGIVTHSIEGKITASGKKIDDQVFLLVKKQSRTLIETSDGYLYRTSASLVFPTMDGTFRVEMGDAVDEIDLYVLAKGYSISSRSFRRTLGVGSYEVNIDLKKSQNWQNEFGYFIKPFVSEFIIEPRYKLLPSHQLFLGNWMTQMEDSLEMKKQ